jgi:hypothetical protein
LAGTIVDGTGFVNSGAQAGCTLKPLEKCGNISEISVVPAIFPLAPTPYKLARIPIAKPE